jgi:hypothetical protein
VTIVHGLVQTSETGVNTTSYDNLKAALKIRCTLALKKQLFKSGLITR